MSGCERFDNEGLLELERGNTLDPHFDDCPDCLEARREYDDLRAAFGELRQEYNPRDGWEGGVWSRVRGAPAREPARPRWWMPAIALFGSAAVAATLALFVIPWGDLGPQLSVTTVSDANMRGADDTAIVGDRLRVEANLGTSSHAELRVYFERSVLLLSCFDEPPCVFDDGSLSAELRLQGRGSYEILLLTAESQLPTATESLDKDLRELVNAGVAIERQSLTAW